MPKKQDRLAFLRRFFPVIPKRRRALRDFFVLAKNGTITGAADNDPAGIVTYTQAGASTGYSLLWLMFFTVPLLIAVEEITARLAVVTKKGLASVIRDRMGSKVAIVVAILVAIANIATIGANLGGMADVLGLLTPWPAYLFSLLFFLLFALMLYRGSYASLSRYFFFLTPFFLAYVISAILARPDWGEALKHTFNPFISEGKNLWLLAVAVLGTTLSPYLLFWQATEEVEEHKKVKDLEDEARGVRWGMIYSNLVFYFVIVASASTLYATGAEIETVKDAALALKPLVGHFAFSLFALGLIVSGFLAIPVLAASTAYVLADACHWEEGLDKKVAQAKGFYFVLFLSLILGLIIAVSHLNPVKVLIYSQVLDGLLMPFLLYFLLRVGLNPKVMGKHLPSFWIRFFGWLSFVVFIVADLALFLT
ncbi:divalent metal cation transporter [bacterium]|nr:divalent metal cation transporter [bacterium]